MPITISRVVSKADLSTFVALPRKIYAGDRRFTPTLDDERRELLDPKKAAFFKHGQADYFLALRDGRPVGRISAQVDDLSAEAGRGSDGLFGCFDVEDDAEAADALVRAAEGALTARGRTHVEGPYLLSINGEAGLLIDGFDAKPMTLVPWHPPHLAGHLARNGYEMARRVHSYALDLRDDFARTARAALRADQVALAATIRPLNMKDLKTEAEIGRMLFNSAWRRNWGFVPLSQSDMEGFVHGFSQILDPDCAAIAEVDGRPVGFAMILPNVFNLFGEFGGTLGPVRLARLLYRLWRRPWDSGRLCLFGVADEYRSLLGASLALAMISELVERAERRGIDWIEAGWVLEDNKPIISLLRRLDFQRIRTHAIYRKAL